MTRLNVINQGTNTYCGPAVLSSITGISTDEAARLVNEVRKLPPNTSVRGVYSHELDSAFRKLGYKVNEQDFPRKTSIYSCMFYITKPGIYLFYIPHHVIAIEITDDKKRYIIDNHTKKPLNLSVSSRLGQKVLTATRISKDA